MKKAELVMNGRVDQFYGRMQKDFYPTKPSTLHYLLTYLGR